VLDEREVEVNSIYNQLDADKQEMASLKEEYESRLSAIENESREKIQTAIKEAQSTRDQIVSDANNRARDIVSKAEQDAERERSEGLFLMRQQIVDLAMGATQKVLGESLTDDKQKQLIDDFVGSGLGTPVSASPSDAPKKASRSRKSAEKDA
jgi:F-type H+-transporting ATPase subunit b